MGRLPWRGPWPPLSLPQVMLVAAAARALGLWSVWPWAPVGDEASYLRVARQWVEGGLQDTFWPPLTGWWLASLWPLTHGDANWSRLATALLDLANVALLWSVARPLSPRNAPWAALAYALYLPAIGFACNATSEVPSLTLVLWGLWGLTRTERSWPTVVWMGAAAGALTLARSNLALMGLAWAAVLWLGAEQADQRGRTRAQAAVVLALSLAVPAAWVARNHAHGEGWVLAHNGSYNLYIGNTPDAQEDLNLLAPKATAAQRAVRAGQTNTDASTALSLPPAQRQALALAAIEAQPLTFVRRAWGRLARVWAPKTAQLSLVGGEGRLGVRHPTSLALMGVATAQWAALICLGVGGLAAALTHAHPPTRRAGRALTATVLGALPLCLLAIAKPRYAFPFEPALMLAAALALPWPRGRARLAAGLVLAFIAWGWLAWALFAWSSR